MRVSGAFYSGADREIDDYSKDIFLQEDNTMALIICPECSHNVSDKAISCPNCGYPINLLEEAKSTNKAPARAHVSPRQKKKNPKLPNGFGSIKKLSGNRRKPYAAYPPVTEYRDNGSPAPVECVGYFRSWHEAYSSLVEWHRLKGESVFQSAGSTIVLTSAAQAEFYKSSLTFAQVYDLYYEDKFRELPGKRALSKSARNSTAAAFKNCASLHDKVFCSLVARDLQEVVDSCPLKHASLELISMLFNQMYAYAIQNDLTDKNYAQYIKINIDDDDETGVPFSQEDIQLLWAHAGEKHTPHDCRHTFSWLCDKYGVDSDSKHYADGTCPEGRRGKAKIYP